MTTDDVFGLGDRAVARAADPETSHEAADSVSKRTITQTQEAILDVLERAGPLSDEEISDALPVDLYTSPSGIRSRRAELVARGLVEWTGACDVTSSRRRTRVWRRTQKGR
jgi:predicted ArsR family transcriptional regulator